MTPSSLRGDSRLRLLVYTDNRDFGGADASLSHLVRAMDRDVDVAVLGIDSMIVEWVARGRAAAETAVVPGPRSGHDWRSLDRHVRTIRALRPHVVHANLSSPWSCQYAIAAAGVNRRPCIAVYQLPVPAVSAVQRLAKRLTSTVVTRHVGVGARTSREVETLLGLRAGSVQTIHNGVPDLRVRTTRTVVPSPIVGTVARLEQQKGIDVLLHAFGEVEGATLVVVGDGSERDHLQALAARLGIDARVTWEGWSENARSYLPSFDVFVLPSRFEGFPLVVLEAQLAQTAVVATDVGSVPETVIDGETGLLVPADDPDALGAAIRRLVGDAELRRTLAERGRRLVLARYTAEHMTRAFRKLYDEVLR